MKRIKRGDVFSFEVEKLGFGFCQVIECNIIQYINVFENILPHSDPKGLGELGRRVLIGWTSDARIYHGYWKFQFNAPVPEGMIYHKFIENINGLKYLTDYNGKIIHLANQYDLEKYDLNFSYSPITYEKALAALHSGEWEERFDRIMVANIEAASRSNPTEWLRNAPRH